MKVEVPEEKIVSEVENRLKSMSKTTKIQGFRPGKVPVEVDSSSVMVPGFVRKW